MSMNQQ